MDCEGEDRNEEEGGESACGDHGVRWWRDIICVGACGALVGNGGEFTRLQKKERNERESEICLNESEEHVLYKRSIVSIVVIPFFISLSESATSSC